MKKTVYHIKILIVILSLLLSLTGCWDRVEVEGQSYVITMGLDVAENNLLEVTYQIANPKGGGLTGLQGSSSKEPIHQNITFKVHDLVSARDLYTVSGTRQLSFAFTRTLVVSEKLAKSDKFYNYMSAILRERQIRIDTYLIICKENTAEFIKNNKSDMESRPQKLYVQMAQRWEETALTPFSTIFRFNQRKVQDADLFLCNYGTTVKNPSESKPNEHEYEPGEVDTEGGNPVQIIGGAVFKKGKMVGSVNGYETRLSLLLREEFKQNNALFSFPDPFDSNYRVTTNLSKGSKFDLKIEMKDSIPSIKVNVPIELVIMSIPSMVDYIYDLDKQEVLRSSIEKQLTEDLNKLVQKMKDEFGGEGFQWSYKARKKFWTFDEYKNYDWMEAYMNSKVQVKTKVKIVGIGKQLSPPK